MRLRLVLLTILAIVLASCTSSGEEPVSISDVEATLRPAAEEAVATLQPAIEEMEETLEPAATDVASTVEAFLTPSALACEELPEVTTEGEDGVTVPENAVAVFQKTGGFAGVHETTVIYADGYIENNKHESFQSSPDEIEMLVSAAEDAGFFDFDRNYVPEGHCCDFFNYSLTIRDCDQINTVMTADEVPGAPAALMQIINTVQNLIANTSAAVPGSGTG